MKSGHDLLGEARACHRRLNRVHNKAFRQSPEELERHRLMEKTGKYIDVSAAEHERQRKYFSSEEYRKLEVEMDQLRDKYHKAVDAVEAANLPSTRFSVVVPADQTVLLLGKPGLAHGYGYFTTKHKNAALFLTRAKAEQAMQNLDIDRFYVECIVSVGEFLNREDTW